MLNLQLAFRSLVKTPLVTAVAILSLALGIGANAAVFSIFERTILRPLPVADPHRLVTLRSPGPKPRGPRGGRTSTARCRAPGGGGAAGRDEARWIRPWP